jgi:ubiquinol-cytochrome c reductase cytochrome c1 subunit
MTNLKKLASLMALGACFAATQGYAAGGGGSHMEPADIDLDNVASLQRGARNFMNYCSGCHSAEYVRFNTIGKTLDLSEEQLMDNLMFNADKTFETIRAAMPANLVWQGTARPDPDGPCKRR